MGDKKDDVRIYVISGLFFACSTSGGILLSLYIFLPTSQGATPIWFSIVGLILVAIPWILWFLIYLHRCFKPRVQTQQRPNHGKPSGSPKPAPLSEVVAMSSAGGRESSVDDGERHVHFGAIVVVENGSSSSICSQRQQPEAALDRHEEFSDELAREEPNEAMLESEMPLSSTTRL